jgi:hypothetical protein
MCMLTLLRHLRVGRYLSNSFKSVAIYHLRAIFLVIIKTERIKYEMIHQTIQNLFVDSERNCKRNNIILRGFEILVRYLNY